MNVPFKSRPDRPLRAAPEKNRRKFMVIFGGLGIFVLLVATSLPAIYTTTNIGHQTQSSIDVQGCRALYSADVTDARTTLDLAIGRSQALQDQFLTNIAATDKSVYSQILLDLGTAKGGLDAAAKGYQAKNDTYRYAIELSQSDPDAFLAMCHQRK